MSTGSRWLVRRCLDFLGLYWVFCHLAHQTDLFRERMLKSVIIAGHWWLTPVILATQETEIRRIEIRSQPKLIVWETLSQKKPFTNTKKRWWSGSRCRPWAQSPVLHKQKNLWSQIYLFFLLSLSVFASPIFLKFFLLGSCTFMIVMVMSSWGIDPS
jgi:hypothetical protein